MNLSILIPTYNTVCVELVKALQRQAEALTTRRGDFSYEIIVADDGSTDKATVKRNKDIEALPRCRYLVREKNVGRAAIRNFLARSAQYEWLLFIDSDMVMLFDDYLNRYADIGMKANVIYGGYTVMTNEKNIKGNLRYTYEKKYNGNNNALARNKHPYNDFHTSNFIVNRNIMLAHPFDERFKHYGYEDVIWGKTLKQNGVKIYHINNQLSFEKFESNAEFISKTEEGMHTLFTFRHELQGYSSVISVAEKIRLMHLLPAASLFHDLFGKRIRNILEGNKTSVFLFNIYKLGFFCSLLAKEEEEPKAQKK